MSERVTLLDYGMGNLRSVQRALEAAGAEVQISTDVPAEGRLVLPGQGAFPEALRQLGPRLADLRAHLDAARPLLGICLGMQLLFDGSDEHGGAAGLGWFRGQVTSLAEADTGVTVPNMGWHRLSGLGDPFVYFAHSFGVAESPDAVATFTHGRQWVAAVRRERTWGFQFHPEKSGPAGLSLLRAWLAC